MVKLIKLEVENFRSIIGDPLIVDFDNLTVVVGPNNCGKSNILRALQLFFTGLIEGQPYQPDIDYPKSEHISPTSQTKITVTMKYDPTKELTIKRQLETLEKETDQIRLDKDLLKMRLSFSKNGIESWQYFGKKGARNIPKDLTLSLRDSLRQSIIFKYIPVGRDSLGSINNEIGSELIKTIFSGWSGDVKKRQKINGTIVKLIDQLSPELNSSSKDVTDSIKGVFPEIEKLELKLPFTNLEELLKSLIPSIKDTAETSISSKGAGLQTSSLLFLLKYIADNFPQRSYGRVTFIWAIEEPESFLHPSKQLAMSELLRGFSSEVQTLITTHCPHFVPRNNSNISTYIIDKSDDKPFSTTIIGRDYELARQTLGVSLLDSMFLYPINLVVEGPSDEILIIGALQKLKEDVKLNIDELKCFPGGNAASAVYLFESFKNYASSKTAIKLVIDGDESGKRAVNGLIERAKKNGIKWKDNSDYFQLSKDIEDLLSDKVKRALAKERPSQVHLSEDINNVIKDFKFLDNKQANARRALDLSDKSELSKFKHLFDLIYKSLK